MLPCETASRILKSHHSASMVNVDWGVLPLEVSRVPRPSDAAGRRTPAPCPWSRCCRDPTSHLRHRSVSRDTIAVVSGAVPGGCGRTRVFAAGIRWARASSGVDWAREGERTSGTMTFKVSGSISYDGPAQAAPPCPSPQSLFHRPRERCHAGGRTESSVRCLRARAGP